MDLRDVVTSPEPTAPSPVGEPSPLPARAADAAISLEGVTRRQGSFALGPLDVVVPRGLVTGFVGPNGAGKTTTIRTILGMASPDAGVIDVLGAPPGTRQDRLGVVLDTLALAPGWTPLAAARVLSRFYPAWNDVRMRDLLRRFEIPAETRVSDLSRGQRVKLGLALALAHDPELLVLDEPTSGLDPVARLDVLDVFREFMVDPTHTVLFSTHVLSDLDRIADRLVVICSGRIAFAGTPDALAETYAMVRGARDDLTPRAAASLIGARLSPSGTFEGLIRTCDTALFPPSALIESPALDEAVAAWTRNADSPAGAPPTAAARPGEEH
ncbi:MAG: ABC transporter ATP-binding protein [Actinomyces sp.]|jgi:ABC-2 type transport system ATP-binding protein|nr:ABC transporter ATP-binding protein [Actinomyces sp.]MCI1788410.1 ABC transporter ATP-binding protein [Actinomyces sp.]MCI1831159.1 ABC transporter ATP-binding protein [Actinomyces sp.]MCI1867200.1 ABC transporter ATP-binding protein [Actinomyces sp.]